MTTRTHTNLWPDLLSLAVMIGLAATGGPIPFVLPAGIGHLEARMKEPMDPLVWTVNHLNGYGPISWLCLWVGQF